MAKNSKSAVFLKIVAPISIFFILFFTTKYVFDIIFNHQPEVFIDEIFHVKQAERIAQGDFKTWDPKITTLPGLYYLSSAIIKGIGVFHSAVTCNLYTLRFSNVIGTLFNFWLLYAIHLKIHGKKQDDFSWKILLSALNLTIFPVLYFFSFLYYTDILSTTFVLLMFLLHLNNCPNTAAVTGGLSILMRQTNAIWVVYFFMHTIYDCIMQEAVFQKKIKSIQQLEKLPLKEGYISIIKITFSTLKDSLFGHHKKNSFFFSRRLIKSVFAKSPVYTMVVLSFVLFIYFNGSIVVGDKTAHTATFHVLQLCYFAAFTCFFAWPFFFRTGIKLARNPARTFSLMLRYKKSLLLSSCVLGLCVYYNFQAHRYLLADNRHYTFYVWRRLFGHFVLKYFTIPLYLFGFVVISKSVYTNAKIDLISFWISTALCLVPQQLLEFRYFLLPYFIFRIKMKNFTAQQLIFEFITYIIINALTVIIFIKKPFYWAHEPTVVQRFIW